MTNRLAHEVSPYLLQHAHNPVDWYPWGEEALAKARAEDRPIFLSIGYSACHWCHVMERESFEDDAVARILNEHFVSIKVDREERPDIDSIYMSAVQMMTGHGGWPMSMFLTPDGAPFYAGTYFPPDDRHGMPGFKRVLLHVAEAYRARKDEVNAAAAEVRSALSRAGVPAGRSATVPVAALDAAAARIAQTYDSVNGGFGSAPKFPPSMSLDFLMQVAWRANDRELDEIIVNTLTKMAHGGMYDQVGGGFHRYSVDARWLVPHFEKMLYDNALLAGARREDPRGVERLDARGVRGGGARVRPRRLPRRLPPQRRFLADSHRQRSTRSPRENPRPARGLRRRGLGPHTRV